MKKTTTPTHATNHLAILAKAVHTNFLRFYHPLNHSIVLFDKAANVQDLLAHGWKLVD